MTTPNADHILATQQHRSRLKETDPTYLRLRDATARRLSLSLQRLVRELRGAHQTEQHTALSEFITRQTQILQGAYIASYQAGAADYFGEVSNTPGVWAKKTPVDPERMRKALAFYAPSIAKMAHQALAAVSAAPGVRLEELIAEADNTIKLFGFGGFHIEEPGGSRAVGGLGGGNDRTIYGPMHRFAGSKPGEHNGANIHEHLAAQHHGEGEGGGGGRRLERPVEHSPNEHALRIHVERLRNAEHGIITRLNGEANQEARMKIARDLSGVRYQRLRGEYQIARSESGEAYRYTRPNLHALQAAKTTSEVEAWLNHSFPGTSFHLGNAHPYAAKQIAQESMRLAHEHPTFFRQLRVVGNINERAARDEVTRLGGDLSLAKGRGVVASTLRLAGEGSPREAPPNGYAILLRGPGLFGSKASVLTHPVVGDRLKMGLSDARDSGRASQVTYTMRHEFGHVVHFALRHAYWHEPESFLGRVYSRITSRDPGAGGRQRISEYAASSDHKMVGANEQYAETFAAGRYGRASVRRHPFVLEMAARLRDIERPAVGGAVDANMLTETENDDAVRQDEQDDDDSVQLGFGIGGLVRAAFGGKGALGGLGHGGMIRTKNGERPVLRGKGGRFGGSGRLGNHDAKGEEGGKSEREAGGKKGLAGREGVKGKRETLTGKRPMTARQKKAEESPNAKAARKEPSVKGKVKAKPNATRATKASKATAEQRKNLDEAMAPRTRTVAQRKSEAEARLGKATERVKTAEKAVKTSQKNLDEAGARAEKMREDNKTQIDQARSARNDAEQAMWRNLDSVKSEVLEKAARERGAAGFKPQQWAKMQEAERDIPAAREKFRQAEQAAKEAESHHQALKDLYFPQYNIFNARSGMNHAEYERAFKEHKDLKVTQREMFRTSGIKDKAKYALWRIKDKYDTNRRAVSGMTEKKFQAALDAHPSRAAFVKAEAAAGQRIADLTGETQHREAFLAHQKAQSELNAAKQEHTDAKALVEHPAWQYEFHSEPLHSALYQNVHSWEPQHLIDARAVDNGAGSNQKNVKVGDQSLQHLQHIQGFDGPADRVSEQELALHAKNGELEIWRGDTSQSHVDELLTGAYHPGYGIYGNGTYFQEAAREGKTTAMSYANKHGSGPKAGKGRIYHATLKQGSRTVNEHDLKRMAQEHIAKEETNIKLAKARGESKESENMVNAHNRMWVAKSDLGRFATALGYDAIRVPSNGQVIVLNRSALRISTQLFDPTPGVSTR